MISSRITDTLDIEPVDAPEFAAELTPCLALASGASMSREDRKLWLNAAFRVVGHLPIGLLRRGCLKAMETADHPSKIIPAIVKEVGNALEDRKQAKAFAEYRFRNPPPPPPPAPHTAIDDNSPLPYDQIKHLTPDFLRLGLVKGWVRQEDYDRAMSKAEAA